ncbi:SGNH/GDSL hydrolase family protein [Mesomycoplasma bovoculi]|uniref:Lipoprotein, GDSL-like lipase family n=1 Tax=Mesomycoplasma bovoculi M165/69 TaxID=743966 RepID=W5UT22_9BACT|nr:SGNH/GDSL hydrolase family protein [Mesomycoplasma bovoculi]AHH45276.1 lipoprotein, GDSL-like lipase family [Mesomycoplasma bovoculi M165/69]
MNKDKKFILHKPIKVLLGTAAIGVATCVVAACNVRKSEEHVGAKELEAVKYENTLVKQVKYLAIGDSLTAGFNLDSGVDSRGNLVNKTVSGLSYPAFFAHYLQKINPDSLVTFDNLALSGTTVKNWLYLLEPQNSTYAKFDKTFLKYANNIDKLTNSPYGKQISDIFGNFDLPDYPKFVQKIKDANLLTFTLGANDLFQSLNLSYLTSLSDNQSFKTVLANKVKQDIARALVEIKANLTKLVEKLKEINPKLKISVLGYKDLNNTAIKFISYLLKNEFGFELEYGHSVIAELNKNTQEMALEKGINYIDPYDPDDWNKNPIYGVDFDIHPSAKGYKKMAQALLYKLALDQSEDADLNNVDIAFLQKDKNDYRRVLDIATNQEIISKVNDKSVLETSDFETQNEKQLANYQGNAQNMFVAFLDTDSVIEKWIIGLISKSDDFQSIANVFLKQNTSDDRSQTKEFLRQLAQSPILNQILAALKSYIQEVKDKNLWDKVTFESLIDGISRKFLLEGGLPALINFVLSNEWLSKQRGPLKDALYKTVFSSVSIQNRVLSLFDDSSDSGNWRVIFEFDSVKTLFSKVLDELLDKGEEYKNSTNFAGLVTNFVKNEANQSAIIDFVQNFSTDALKQPIFTTLLVNLVDKKANLGLTEQEKVGISSALLGLAENITATKTFKNLARTVTITLINNLKSIDSTFDRQKLTQMFLTTLGTSFKNFFTNKDNLYTLVQDLLQTKLRDKQVEILSKLLQRTSWLISTLDLSTFYNPDAQNYAVVKVVFDSAKEFLQENSFAQINNLFAIALKDFFITNRDKYVKAVDFDSFVFQLVAHNSEQLKKIIYDFLAAQGSKDNFNNAVATLLSGLLDKYNYKPETKTTISKIIKAILQDFSRHGKDNDDNIINLLLNRFATEMRIYVANNNGKQDVIENDYNKSDNQSKRTTFASKYDTLRRKLNFNDFLTSFAQSTLKDSTFLRKTLKSFAQIFNNKDVKQAITSAELADAIFDILQSQQVTDFFKNSIHIGKIDINLNQELADIIGKFLKSEELHKLLKAGIDFIFNVENLDKYTTLSQLLLEFLKENRSLVDDAIAVFVDKSDVFNSINSILDKLLKANNINLANSQLETLKTIIKDLAHETRLAIESKSKQEAPKRYSPQTISAIIGVVTTTLLSNDGQDFNNSLIDLTSSLIYDISNIYFKKDGSQSSSEHQKLSAQNLLDLVKGFLKSDFATNLFKQKFGDARGQNLKELILFFLETNGASQFVQSVFELIAEQTISKDESLFSVLKKVVENEKFTSAFVDFVKQIDDNQLAQKTKSLLDEMLGVTLDQSQITSFFKWTKLILTDNLKNEDHNYSNANDLVKILSKILAKLFEQRAQNRSFDLSELANEFANEDFIVNFIKQLAATLSNVDEEDKTNIGKLIISILGSQTVQNSIKNSINSSSVFANLSDEAKDSLLTFIKDMITNEKNVDLIVGLISTVGENSAQYKNENKLSSFLKLIIKNPKFKEKLVTYINSIDISKHKKYLATILNSLLGSSVIKDEQVGSFLKWIKLILTNNIDGKQHIYADGNSLINKIIDTLDKLLDTTGPFNIDSVKASFTSEEFLVDLLKQLATTFIDSNDSNNINRIDTNDRRNIAQMIVSILDSSFISKTIDSLDLSSLQTYLGNNSQEDVQAIKNFIKELIKQPGNVDFIESILSQVAQNINEYNNVHNIVDVLKHVISHNKDLITKYLWQVIDFAVNNKGMSKVFAKIIAKQLKLDTQKMTDSDYEPISNFLKGLVDRADKSDIVVDILNGMVNQINSINKFDASFFAKLFSSISGGQLFDFDFVIKINGELNKAANSDVTSWKKLDNTSPNSPFNAKTFAGFFDTILAKAPKWDRANENDGSIILKALNNIKYTGIDYSALIFGGSKAKAQATQLSSIADIFKQIYVSVKDSITIDNFRDTPEGRSLYRLMFLTLFYAYESQFKGASHAVREYGFYSATLGKSTATVKIFNAFKSAVSSRESYKGKYDEFIDKIHGEAIKGRAWWGKIYWYDNTNVKSSDMVTMIFYNQSENRFKNTTHEPKLKDQIIEQIRQGYFDTNLN